MTKISKEKKAVIRLLNEKNARLVYGFNALYPVSIQYFGDKYEFSKDQMDIINNISFEEFYNIN